jgi:hypothetical protein
MLLLLGCGTPAAPALVRVQGTVTFDGKPVETGTIYFITVGEVPASLAIEQGKFSGSVKPGQKRIEIAAWRSAIVEKTPEGVYPPSDGVRENYLPLRYHAQSTLSETVHETGDTNLTFTLNTDP